MNAAATATSALAALAHLTRAWARAFATLDAVACLVTLASSLVNHGKVLVRAIRASVGEAGVRLARALLSADGIDAVATHAPAAGHALPVRAARPAWRQTHTVIHLLWEATAADSAHPRRADPVAASIGRYVGTTAALAVVPRHEPFDPLDRFGGRLTQFIAEVGRCKAPASRVETPRFEAPPERLSLGSLSAEEQSSHRPPPQATSARDTARGAEPRSASRPAREQTETAPPMCPVALPPAREVVAPPPL